MQKLYHHLRQFVVFSCLFPASFLQYPKLDMWTRAMRDPREAFKAIYANNEELLRTAREKGTCVFLLVGLPLRFARQIRHHRSVWRALDWNCGKVLARLGIIQHSAPESTEWLLPSGPLTLISGLVEQRIDAVSLADSLLDELPDADVSINGHAVRVSGEDGFAGQTVAVLAHWDDDQRVDPYVRRMIEHFHAIGWKVVLSSSASFAEEDVPSLVDGLVYRTCPGYDFTSWKAALACFPSLLEAKELILCNDSVFGGIGSYAPMHEVMDGVPCDFWGITESRETLDHIQSFHLVFREKAIRNPAFSAFFRRVPLSDSRTIAVEFETHFALWLARHGLQPAAFAPVAASIPLHINPSCECWKTLIESGVPLLKRELLFKNDRRVNLSGWVEVLKARNYPLELIFQYAWRRGFDLTPLLSEGTRTGTWPTDVLALQRSIALPKLESDASGGVNAPGMAPADRPPLGVFVHVFYTHLMPEVAAHLDNLPRTAHIHVSTDTEAKAEEIRTALEPLGFASLLVRVLPNKGWDIAPFIVGFAEEIRKYPLIVRIHAKCSAQIPQETADAWRHMLFSSLLGSKERVQQLEALFASDTRLGMICPPPVAWYAGNVNAAGNLEAMNRLLAPSGLALSPDEAIDFPMGSMFWCRSKVLEPWLSQGLTFEDFDLSDGQQRDGSLAHALERLFLFGCGIAGLRWGRVAPAEYGGLVPVPSAGARSGAFYTPGGSTAGYASALISDRFKGRIKARVKACVKRVPYAMEIVTALRRKQSQMASPVVYHSAEVQAKLGSDAVILAASAKPELVVILPRVHPLKFSGGPNTILLFAAEVAKLGYGVHCLSESPPTCSSEVLRNHLQELLSVDREVAENFRVSCMSQRVTLNANDRLLATAWWTVGTAKTLAQRMTRERFFYFIQDFEPLFYPWNEEHAGAMLTYGADFLPVFNESYLADFCFNVQPGRFANEAFRKESLVFTPAVDRAQFYPEVRKAKQHSLLFYARPNAPRNLYHYGLEAMHRLVKANIITADRWTIECMGEDTVPQVDLGNGVVTSTVPWLGFADYASRIRQASVGLSLMLSPHTSYMPLELAAAGVPVVTTSYVNKTTELLAALSPDIIGTEPTIEGITEGLREAVARAEAADTLRTDSLAVPSTWTEAFAPIMPRVVRFMETGE